MQLRETIEEPLDKVALATVPRIEGEGIRAGHAWRDVGPGASFVGAIATGARLASRASAAAAG